MVSYILILRKRLLKTLCEALALYNSHGVGGQRATKALQLAVRDPRHPRDLSPEISRVSRAASSSPDLSPRRFGLSYFPSMLLSCKTCARPRASARPENRESAEAVKVCLCLSTGSSGWESRAKVQLKRLWALGCEAAVVLWVPKKFMGTD